MKILVTGATGFIGSRVVDALAARGHIVVAAVRHASTRFVAQARVELIETDFARDIDPAAWRPRLAGVDAIVNAAGILRERATQTFGAVHVRAPKALFAAAVTAGVRRIVQVSALGADAGALSRYHRSKKEADDFLRGLPLDWVVVKPSVVYGPDGASARLFTMLASLPLVPVPGDGAQSLQPVHVDDVVQGIVALVESTKPERRDVDVVGPAPLALRDYLARLRHALGLGNARCVRIPLPMMMLAARVGDVLPRALLDTEILGMLTRGNTGDPAALTGLLNRQPRGVDSFVAAAEAPGVRALAKMQWLLPALRLSIAAVWIWTGIVSLGVYPVEESYALLSRVGATGGMAALLLYGAAALDFALGVGTLVMHRRRWLWLAQIAVILAYTGLISARLPEFWIHPYGPVLKNLPMLAALWLLYELEERR